MLVVFEVILAPGADPDTLITEDTKSSTGAQIMTLDEARKVGFGGLPDRPGKEVRLIAVNHNDRQWIQRQLETNDAAGSYHVHEVD